MKNRFGVIAILTLVLASSVLFCSPVSTAFAAEVGITVGKTAPAFSLQDLNGKTVQVGSNGKITVINFWATWCPPCRAEMPELDAFAEKHKGKILFAAVNLRESAETVKGFINKAGFSMPVLLDKDGRVGGKYGIRAIPTTIILDSNGVIKYRKSGRVTSAELEAKIAEFAKL